MRPFNLYKRTDEIKFGLRFADSVGNNKTGYEQKSTTC